MLDAPPKEPELLSWTYVGLGALLIFCIIPFAREIQLFFANQFGGELFLYIVWMAVLVVCSLATINLRRRGLPASAYLWLIAVCAGLGTYAYALRNNPVEAIHLVEYGLLGLLVYRALVHRIRDYSVYVAAALVVGMIGIIDEWIQWIVPSRYWGLRDLQINLVAGGLTQLAIGAGLRPAIISGRPSWQSYRRLSHIAALGLFMLGLSYMNTPERIAIYAMRIPSLSFLLDSKSVMIEYGYLYRDPEIGVFRSRFRLEELHKYDRERGLDAAEALDHYINDDRYEQFLTIYNVHRDAYVHEAGVHVFRRNKFVRFATFEESRRGENYDIAFRENRILEKYFPTALENSTHLRTPELRQTVEKNALKKPEFRSAVGSGLVTRFNEGQIVSGFVLAIAALLLLAAYCGRKDSRSA